MDDETVKQMYTTNLEIANYYDSMRNIKKTLEYSFIVCQEDPTDTVCVTKIVYWSSIYKDYDTIMKLFGLVRNNKIQINKLKEIFYRENKKTLKDLIVKLYIDTIEKKEKLSKQKNIVDDTPMHQYLINFYRAIMDMDICTIYDLWKTEDEDLAKL